MRSLFLSDAILAFFFEAPGGFGLSEPPLLICFIKSSKLVDVYPVVLHGFEFLCVGDVLVEAISLFVVLP